MESNNPHMLNLLKVGESLLAIVAAFFLIIGTLVFAFFGIMDITGSSNIGLEANHVMVGAFGLLVTAVYVYGYLILKKKEATKQIVVAAGILILGVMFMYISPTRIGALGGFDTVKFASYWSVAASISLLLLVAAQKATGRSN